MFISYMLTGTVTILRIRSHLVKPAAMEKHKNNRNFLLVRIKIGKDWKKACKSLAQEENQEFG